MRDLFKYIIILIILFLCQVFVLDKININFYLLNIIHPFIYFYIILIVPNIPKWIYLISAFLLGIFIDLVYSTPGVNASAMVCLAYIRDWVLYRVFEGDRNEIAYPHIAFLGLRKFLIFTFYCTIIYQTISTFLAVFSFSSINYTLWTIILNTIMSMILVLIVDLMLFYNNSTGRQS